MLRRFELIFKLADGEVKTYRIRTFGFQNAIEKTCFDWALSEGQLVSIKALD